MTNEPTIEIMNVALAAFEGRKFNGHPIDKFGGDTCNALPEMKYHTSWDWLMEVVKKISKLIDSEEYWEKRWLLMGRRKPIANELCNVNIDHVHYCVYQFITWLNQQKQKDGTK